MKLVKYKKNEISSQLFNNPSAFSKVIRFFLKNIILPFTEKENRAAYEEQFPEASRNVEVLLEGALKLLPRHPFMTARLLAKVQGWVGDYSNLQEELAERERYFVYTEHDHRIPFIPEEDTMYVHMIAQLTHVFNDLADHLTWDDLGHVIRAFDRANLIANDAFRMFPTTMPRFKNHDRITLRAVHWVDAPLNCVPSMHIAYSMLLDNIAHYFIPDEDLVEKVRYSSKRTFNSVLYTKQHSLVDVAFGMLCAKQAFEVFNYPYNHLMDTFPLLKEDHPDINYDMIREIYEEHDIRTDLSDLVGRYLQSRRFPLIHPDVNVNGVYFDTFSGLPIRTDKF